MISIGLVVSLFSLLGSHATILKCDFEAPCIDFIVDSNWGITNGMNPRGIGYDHTLNSSEGHYQFYAPQYVPPYTPFLAEIKTKEWLDLPNNETICFQMWYFTPRISMPFTIQQLEGDDELMVRILATISGKDVHVQGWALVNLTLPSERMKLAIRLNSTSGVLDFDDISIDFCGGQIPEPPKVLFECDFESSCNDRFVSLPDYAYDWQIMTASNASLFELGAPSFDYTYGNESGHYALVRSSKTTSRGNVGYFSIEHQINITETESFCLNFEYYAYGKNFASYLKVYAQLIDDLQIVQQVWPPLVTEYM